MNTREKRQKPLARSTFDALGGRAGLTLAVERFYESVLADAELQAFFDGVDLDWLRASQVRFFAQALGGPVQYAGRSMQAAHRRLRITRRHFDLVAGHLLATLDELGVSQEVLGEVVAAVTPLADWIVNPDAASNTDNRTDTERETTMTPNTGNASAALAATEFLEQAGMGSAVLDSLQSNVFICDLDYILIFANQRALATLRAIEPVIQSQFGVGVNEIVGGSIHRFHADPRHNERILKDASNFPRSAEFSFGGITLMTHINTLSDSYGETVGYIVAWTDETQRRSAETEQARIHSLVENAPTNIMCADKEGTINYMNPASQATLKSLEKLLPIPVSQIVGSSFDVFHAIPAKQRAIILDPANLPHRAEIALGGETLDLLVSPMRGADGEYLGPMVTWEVITIRKELENEQARMLSLVENAPINIMCADREGTITYMNPASESTLNGLQKLLPMPVSKMIGARIDAFHKVPEMQLRIIGDPANLPHRAEIILGNETLDLLVSPMFGSGDAYLGPMVTWEVITARLQQERDLAEAQRREQEQAATLAQKVGSMLEVVQAAASGDLTMEVTVSGDDAIGRMGDGLKGFLAELRGSIGQISEGAQSLAGASEELSAISQQMGAASEETSAQAEVVAASSQAVSANVQTVASGTEEMSASIREIAQNANTAARVATDAVRVAEDTNVTVGKLGESSAEIGQVIKVITSIAQQTNLLALNATIEAARAGDAGKGFAVVANEVKELAKETAKATEDISRKIEAIQADTQESVNAIERIGEIIAQINDIQGTIASAVEEQTATTNEMAQNVNTASTGLDEIVSNIKSVATAAVDTSGNASDTQKAAADLSGLASQLQALVGKFQI